MNKFYSPLFFSVIFLSCFCHNAIACGFDFVGNGATSIRFLANSQEQEYFVTTCSYGHSFSGSIGTDLTSLQLASTTGISWESCTNIVQESNVFFRIFKDSTNKGAFQKIAMSQQGFISNPPYRTRTYMSNASLDLLNGLFPNTTYSIEIYYQLGVDSDTNRIIDKTKVADNGGAYYSMTFQTGNINAHSDFPVSISTQNPSCGGGSNGSATATASGGIPPYLFAWSNGATTATVKGLAAGTYSVTVTDSTHARAISSIIITEPIPITTTFATTNAGCGLTNASVNASASGGDSPYTYLWDNHATTASISNLAPGSYHLTVTDAKGCLASSVVTLADNCGGGGTYCASSGSPWTEWIVRVQFNTLDNTSGKIRPEHYVVGYSDWRDKTAAVYQGASYPLSVSPGLSWVGQQSNCYFRAWIDFNQNGIFEDTEKVFEKNAISADVSDVVLIPKTALVGTTVMRVSMKKDAYPTACESFAAGEVEDYSVAISSLSSDTCISDTIKPILAACPANINLTTIITCAAATWTNPTATDNCTAAPSVTSNYTSGFCFPVGTTTVTCTAKDAHNNASTCSFNVVVTAVADPCATDSIKPVLTACPSNISLTTNSTCASATWAAPIAKDNCTTTPSVTSNYASGFCFPIGTTKVIYTAKDARNNTSTCSFDVVITQIVDSCATDSIKPVLTACPSNISLTTNSTCVAATWTAPTAKDNCTATPSVTSNYASGFCFPIGTTTVVYTAKDARNNASTCSFNVVVAGQIVTGADMALSVTSANATFTKWTPIKFRISAQNNGATPFSNTKIEFKFPEGTANAGATVSSVGLWEEWCAGNVQCYTWSIPTLAANSTATLDIPLFVLDVTSPITATAKLLSSTPIDNITSNNTGSVTINPNTAPTSPNLQVATPTESVPVVIKQIVQDLTDGPMFVQIESFISREEVFLVSDVLGRVAKTETRSIEKGSNIILFNSAGLPRGIYFLVPASGIGQNAPVKFVKM